MRAMQLDSVFIPPRGVCEAVSAAVRAVPEPRPVAVEPARSGVLGRLFGRREDVSEHAPHVPALEHVPVDHLHLPITGFGNLTPHDGIALAEILSVEAAGWPTPTVHLAGGTALEFTGDRAVWARLDGEVDDLVQIARAVPVTVAQLGYFVDRRIFRPMLAVAAVTETTTGPYLEAVVEALQGFESEEWTVDHLALTTVSYDAGTPVRRLVHRIQLGS